MSLSTSTIAFFAWFSLISKAFWRDYPALSAISIFASVVSRVASLVAFILPLKILLLATSSSVPEYLRFLVGPIEKDVLILWLSVSAFLFYALSVFSELISDKFSSVASAKIMLAANTINISGDQAERVKAFYATFSDIWAKSIFSALALFAISFLNLWLTISFFLIFLLEFLVTALILRNCENGPKGKVSGFVLTSYRPYLSLLMSINFLFSFVILLIPFLMGSGLNVVVTVVSIILARQLLASLTGMVTNSVKIFSGREGIEPLIFRHVQLQQKELKKTESLRQATEKLMSYESISRLMGPVISEAEIVSVKWVDPLIRDVNNLRVVCGTRVAGTNQKQACSFQLQIFGGNWKHLVKNEDILFKYVKRSDIGAPAIVSKFSETDFHCQLLSLGGASDISADQWRIGNRSMLERHWSIKPPKALIRDYASSHQLLHQRFDRNLVAKAAIACNGDQERDVLMRFMEQVQVIQRLVQKFPLYIRNQDFHPSNALAGENDECILVSWGRWSVQPIGVKLPSGISDHEVAAIIDKVRLVRDDIPHWFSVSHVNFSVKLLLIEDLLKRHQYSSALSEMEAMLKSPVLTKEELYA